jgi:hypothetical protein
MNLDKVYNLLFYRIDQSIDYNINSLCLIDLIENNSCLHHFSHSSESFVASGAARWHIFKPKIPIWVNF